METLRKWMDTELCTVVKTIKRAVSSDPLTHSREGVNIASKAKIIRNLEQLLSVLFPGVLGTEVLGDGDLELFLCDRLRHVSASLADQAERVLNYVTGHRNTSRSVNRNKAEKCVRHLVSQLPKIRKTLQKDIQAGYDGDPAAISKGEVLITYPYIETVATFRMAHELYLMELPIIPRAMTEWAHSRTGIDIHPGAAIGPSFFIDHGTGVVIGETAVIGKNVKLYQGVTLGALSFPKDKNGNPIKGIKRHPRIGDNVVIYAGATVLGGETVIGNNAIIGGNCWITSSVPANTLVSSDGISKALKKKA